MNDLDRQTQYASNQHDLACVALGITIEHNDNGETLLDAVRAFLRDRNQWRDEAKLREKKLEYWKHECNVLREQLEADISTFINLRETIGNLEDQLADVKWLERERNDTANTFMEQVKKLQDQLASERALADQLAAIVQRDRDGHGGMLTDPECFCDDCEYLRVLDAALDAWKEARK